ncbi:MAG: GNAT family N-acetyltransferase [Bacilli bacterium]|nr:GNAT family N-acetyltransferase [Bacilli bacterium]MDD3422573.1 GNAT family N-acetyltransferase [Bacilli bacterium]MDD4065514.1 GNAT family N-acetyltransferase [Bacilli bacterium]
MLKPIITERLIIREMTAGDRLALFNNIYHDHRVLETFMGEYKEDLSEVNIQPFLDRLAKGQYLYAVTLKSDGTCIGFIFEQKRSEDHTEIEMGYAYGSAYWGKGYATEAFKPLINQLLYEDGFKTVTAGFFMQNTASKNVMEKSGMKYDYIDWKSVPYHYKKQDVVYYRIDKPGEKAPHKHRVHV